MTTVTTSPINLNAKVAFEAVREKMLGLHAIQFKQEGKKLYADPSVLAKIAMYHLCLAYALLLKVTTLDPTMSAAGIEYWKTDTGYADLKVCAANLNIDLDSILSNTI